MKKIVVNDPETRSADAVAENLEHLKALFPDAFTEGRVNFEGYCSSLYPVGTPRYLTGLFRRRIAWDDGSAIPSSFL